MLSSGEKDNEIGDAVPGRGNLATSSGFIASAAWFAESGILADASLGAGRTRPLEEKASALPSPATPMVVATRRAACITGNGYHPTRSDQGLLWVELARNR